MKVALINSVCGFGSTGRIVVDQYNKLVENGHSAMIVYGRKAGDEAINAYKMGSRLSTLFAVVATRIFDSHGFNNRVATQKLLKELDAFQPDIIHLHNIHGYYINVKILFDYINAKSIPVVWNLHDCWSFTGHCSHFEYVDCQKWQSECAKCPQKSEYPASFCLDRSRKNYILKKAAFTLPKKMTFVVPSSWLGRVLNRSFLSGYPSVEIPTGIDLDAFKPTETDMRDRLGLKGKFILLGAASVMTERKGYSDFLWLAEHLPGSCQLVLAGLTEKQTRGLPKNIMGIARIKSVKEMAELYSMADVFINLTKEDTFPTVNLESLACGTPVITYQSGGSGDMLNAECGVIVKRDDKEALLDAVMRGQASLMKKDACIKQAAKYNREKQTKKIISVYHELLN